MNFLVLCLLCVIQGVTEFLPISSSGHLLLIEQIFGIKENTLLLNLFLHLSTLCAVVVVYRKTIWRLMKKPFQPLTYKLMLSTLLTLVFAVGFKKLNLDSWSFEIYGLGFLATAIVLSFNHLYTKKCCFVKTGGIGVYSAIAVGIAQGLAVLPGLSRSGTTISTLTFCGNNEIDSAEFSFLMSVPIIVGGFLLEFLENGATFKFSGLGFFECFFAFIFTFFVSILTLKTTIKLLKNNKFVWFAVYLFVLGISVCVWNFIV